MPTITATIPTPVRAVAAADFVNKTPRSTRPPMLRLSPSRAADFAACELKYRFIALDKIRAPRSVAALRGIVVHKVLEELFAVAPAQRTRATAAALVTPVWEHITADPDLGVAEDEIRADPSVVDDLLIGVHALVDAYFELEDPALVTVAGREKRLYARLGQELALTGIADRIDNLGGDTVGVIDYKTGTAPQTPDEQSAAVWQLKFYALIWWRSRGVAPSWVRLLYPGSGRTITYTPDEGELADFQATVSALAAQITRAIATGVFTANPSAACGMCDFQRSCPASIPAPPPAASASEAV
ncbi:PD-(D/E)XK nuclease family protein [Nocardia sp. XZ_19_369]|uniref:RecB family exonuclease n=1 Tax=Nocardia sp. XZ_19_369 TaxID=2769487 RepID=UPI00188F2C83|nr:PD-(D/E)XK nuclease family protein [Nocardia sp. XZ_19_369]